MLRALLFALAVSSALGGNACAAGAPAELYQAKPIVTGIGEENRQIGFALAFKDVLVKVSGDPRLLNDPRIEALASDAASFVAEFSYRDRMEGIPIHDEQGSYDRPHDLTTIFVPGKIDAVLASLGSKPWPGQRPTITLFLSVINGERTFALASDGERGVDMRDSLASASAKIGIPVTLPDISAEANVEAAARAYGGRYALVGSLVWSDAELGWIADWRIVDEGKAYAWRVEGVSFDDAFRNGIRGVAQVLSGNGEPD